MGEHMSRPSSYSDELAQLICDRLMDGESLRQICADEGMPHRRTIMRWMEADAAFATKCARAREEQADVMDERILDVANRTEAGELPPDAARVVLSALQWRAAKLKPKKYGERQTVEHEGAVAHYVVEVPTPAGGTSEWLKQLSSGVPSPAPSSTS